MSKLTSGLKGSLSTLAGYGVASGVAGYALGAYPDRMRYRGVPTLPLAGGIAKALSLSIGQFGLGGKFGGLAGKSRPILDVIGNAFIAVYIATIATSKGFPKSGRARLVVPAGDINKVKAAAPTATIVGVSQPAPRGRELTPSDIEAIARGR